jgi:nucleotide-binding universal stress UspA family protein
MKKKHNSLILLPYDFTEVSNTAVEHAVGLAKLFNYGILILNIFDSGTKDYMRNNNLKKDDIIQFLNDLAAGIKKEHGIEADFAYKNVKIKDIKKIAKDTGTTFMILGFEKPRSRAKPIMKLIAKSPVPVLIIQNNVPWKKYEKIFFPVDDFNASRQKAGIAKAFATATGADIHIFSFLPQEKEKKYRQHKILSQLQEFFCTNNCNNTLEIDEARNTTEFISNGLKKYNSEDSGFDLVAIMQRPKKWYQVMHKVDKMLIFNNPSTPVIYVNLRDLFVGGGFH